MSTRQLLEVRGRTITTFIAYEATVRLGEMADGDVLEMITEDQEAIEADLAAWCRAAGHRLLSVERDAAGLRFAIEKGAARERRRKAAFVISDPGLEKLLSPLGSALAAALAGHEVHVYFQGPAVRLLTKGYTAKLQGLARPVSRFGGARWPGRDTCRPTRSCGS